MLQAKLLLEINAQTVDTVLLLDTLLPLLQSTIPLMHPDQPCAPIRNETTLLAAAVVALPLLPQTTAMMSLLRHFRQLCWQAVEQSCWDQGLNWKQWHDVHAGSEVHDRMDEAGSSFDDNSQGHKHVTDVNAGTEGNGSMGEGRSRKDAGDYPLQGGNTDPVDPLLCGGANPRAPWQGDDTDPMNPLQPGGANPMTHLQSGGANPTHPPGRGGRKLTPPLQCDDTDPMASLWLKNATLMLFGRDLQLALRRALPDEDDREACGLREEEVQTALRSRSYDVRAACLKACIHQVASGISAAASAAVA